ncbi:serine/threonine protein kinase [Spizellomyces punctatus DAOM BR117]|uniref:Serine/threonine protein kinase n=1 Tax=Spizellomyces punctatus (strain DAOM BR117) TaxID=645134 RepID=A0A0L0HGJ4_SPIPD|nr:serine/threonine protein kinase [Spizellomyces punctatus DAOM BR117]KND00040.1 serine/threonine protein kinase [Spizellomyces punctatus DAOM BR117]|eukprot:XP_016608079.1 serine/threonine protein kinase [Spizellomyces punctatus DAOM BR117]
MELFGSSWRCSAIRPTEHNPFPSAIRPVRRRAMDLFELLEVKPLTEDDAHTIFLQIITAVDALFTNYHLIHGDIKDENILIDWSGTLPIAKLIDFGGALQNVDTNTRCTESDFHGTLEFAPPEIVLGKGYDPEKAEAWSLGVLLYGMVNRGSGPFATPHQTAFGGYQLPKCSDACQELIGRMLVKDQRYRAGFKEILEHPWVVGKR